MFGCSAESKKAQPPESGPRSAMQANIGTISRPSSSRKESVFASRPMIPHMHLVVEGDLSAEMTAFYLRQTADNGLNAPEG